jgi:hypothetical protein
MAGGFNELIDSGDRNGILFGAQCELMFDYRTQQSLSRD